MTRENKMLVSLIRMPRRALPMLSGVVCLMLSGAPSPAQQSGAPVSARAPRQAVEVIAPAQTVLETVHYQAELALVCNALTCFVDFPKPGAKRRLNVTRMTCILRATLGSSAAGGYIQLRNANLTHVLYHWLPTHHSSPDGFHTLNRAVDVQVASSQHIRVAVILASGTTADGSCTASGTLERLQ
jgi:hypothetical protein